MNRALIDLGIADYRVENIVKEVSSNRDVDEYVVILVSTVEGSKTYSMALNP